MTCIGEKEERSNTKKNDDKFAEKMGPVMAFMHHQSPFMSKCATRVGTNRNGRKQGLPELLLPNTAPRNDGRTTERGKARAFALTRR